MLTRKHYKVFAHILKTAYEQSYIENGIRTGIIENHTGLNTISEIANNIEEYFRGDNPRFDENRFKKACEVDFKELNKQLQVE